MKYMVRDAYDDEILEVFYAPDDREEWAEENCDIYYGFPTRYYYNGSRVVFDEEV